MMNTQQHIAEYKEQIEQYQRNIIALQGAIQALERIEREQESQEEEDGRQDKD